ncbi:MAG TPA: NADH-quinone oxidoreductase subunit C [Gammaproteobacteria bacterium]|nr:NADH-quinone oxidoreductase subunit C [Gammaproteobacteria bacterium]
MSGRETLLQALAERYPGAEAHDAGDRVVATVAVDAIRDIATMLSTVHRCEFGTLVVEEDNGGLLVRYFFHNQTGGGQLVEVIARTDRAELPAIGDQVHAADWHEREAEDMFGIHFRGHPFLGDFILHDTEWPEAVEPMRHAFDPSRRERQPGLGPDWQPRRLLREPGALAFPVGPVWADYAESGLWLLETPGEQIRQAHSRLFYKYRGVEKMAEGQIPEQAVLLAERFSGSAAFAHALAFCQAIEKLAGGEVPARAKTLRVVFAELERIRYHAMTIAELAGSTGLVVAKAMAQATEETLLRLTGEVCGHRYLFGLIAPGGLAWSPDHASLARLNQGLGDALAELGRLERRLVNSSSFLDRIEEMGTLAPDVAAIYGVVGPVGRASGRAVDLRRALPYAGYEDAAFSVPTEEEGDGYARLRVFFAEIRASADLIRERLAGLPDGPVAAPWSPQPGAGLGWVEAPAGAAFHWVRLDEDGTLSRWRIDTPGFRNWHAFHRAVEGAAFQDFPIILASFGLSVAENDR